MKKRILSRKNFRFTLMVLLWIAALPAFGQPLGDVDGSGDVTIVDALKIARYYVGMSPAGFNPEVADADDDGSITIVDALVVARYYVGLIDSLPPHKKNPFDVARWYVNPLWSEKAENGGGSAVAGYNTAIWLNRIKKINEGMGVKAHLDEALAQEAGVILFVIANLPNRDCSGSTMNAELLISEGGMKRYKTEFIDPLAAVFSDPAYKSINIVCIIEPNTMANLISGGCCEGLCAEAVGPDGYSDGIQYALNQLSSISNVYNYISFANSGWLGWYDNFNAGLKIFSNVVRGADKGVNSIDGFVTNVAYYTPLEEPFLPDPNLQINGQPVRSSDFYEWNSYFGELKFAQDIYTTLVKDGFPPDIGMLIDTSRNGWGGPDRPQSVSSSSDLNTYVDESRVDRRLHRGNWCNQTGGIGQRPRANPAANIDAFVWAWPPGYSDGISTEGVVNPADLFSIHDYMCDPDRQSFYNPDFGTGAIDAPFFESWNQEHFDLLLQNAYPPL